MMKKVNTRAAVLAALMLGAVGVANAEGFYAGGSVGGSDWNSSVNGLQGDRSGASGKVFLGYEFKPYISLEGGIMSLGHTRDDGFGKASGDGAYLDAVSRYEFAPKWSVVGRGGVARARFTTPAGDATSNGLKVGAGIQYDVAPAIAVLGEYEYYHFANAFDSKLNVGQFTAGVKFSF
jgi:opacity protein-like surface antigen